MEIKEKSKLNSEKIWKIQKKSKLKSEKIGKKVREIEMFYIRHVLGKQLSDISRVVFQTLRFEKVRENEIFYNIMYQKASSVAFQTCGLKKYGKNVRENEMFYNVKG